MNNRTAVPTFVGVAVIMLVIGVAIGSIAFPVTTTKTEITTTLTNYPLQRTITNVTTTLTQNITYTLTVENNESTSPTDPSTVHQGEATTTTITGCTQLESGPLFLTVRSSSTGNPLSSVPVQVEETTPVNLCTPTSTSSTNFGVMQTNINGSIQLCGACTGSTFFFSIDYLGSEYHFNATDDVALGAECVTYYVPSGITNISYVKLSDYYQC